MDNSITKSVGFWSGLGFFLLLILVPAPDGLSIQAKHVAAVTVLMMIWWFSETIPVYATAFVPLALFPVLADIPASSLATNYGHSLVLLLLSGFFIARGLEEQQVHKRIALSIIQKVGTGKRQILLGFMIASAFLSMWLANMIIVLLMLPIALAIIQKEEETGAKNGKFDIALLLGIAYASSVGGTGSLIGTPPNLVLAATIDKLFPEAPEISFLSWMLIGLPLILILLPVVWYYIVKYYGIRGSLEGGKAHIDQSLADLGPMKPGEKRALAIFIFTAIGWLWRNSIQIDDLIIPGWSDLLGVAEYVNDSTVGMLGALLMFIVKDKNTAEPLLNWNQAKQIPWGPLMLIGGGLALATGFKSSGLADYIGASISFIGHLPVLLIIVSIVAFMLFFTEVNSNTATATLFLPLFAAIAVGNQLNPLLFLVPATFACSFAFMLPIATGPNMVIFGSERVSIAEMARCGFWLNLICIVLLTALLYFLIIPVWGIEVELPAWVF
ncbi:MAG: SLC13 family permease [Saprospiraceae bacterium]